MAAIPLKLMFSNRLIYDHKIIKVPSEIAERLKED